MGKPDGSLFHWLYTYHILPSFIPEVLPVSFLVIVLLVIVSILATRRRDRVPGGLQNAMEWAVEGLENFTVEVIGPGGEQYTPFIGTCFLYILAMNFIGFIPLLPSPTINLTTTVSLGLTAIVAVHYYGIKTNGVKRWASHFVGEPLWLAPLLIPLHILGEVVRPLSLSLRLFGNIFGEDTVIAILAGFSPVLLRIAGVPVLALPAQFPMLVFALLTDLLQALVFSMLVAIYIRTTIGDHPGHERGGHGHGEEGEYDLIIDAVPV